MQILSFQEDISIGDGFGQAVAIDGSVVVVSARTDDDNGVDSGSAYLFDSSTVVILFTNCQNKSAKIAFGHSSAII